MFARRVSVLLNPNAAAGFAKKLDAEVIPLLRKQDGFQDEIAFATKDGKRAIGISLWDKKESADLYERATYPEVVKLLAELTSGEPRVETYEVSNSTFHKTLTPSA